MLYFATHLNIAMIAIGLIGLYGCEYEPGPVPRLMVTISGLYLLAFWLVRAIYVFVYERRHKKAMYYEIKSRDPQIFDLKEDEQWTA